MTRAEPIASCDADRQRAGREQVRARRVLEAAARHVVPVVVGHVLVARAARARLPELDRPCRARDAVRTLARAEHVVALERALPDDPTALAHTDLRRRVRDERSREPGTRAARNAASAATVARAARSAIVSSSASTGTSRSSSASLTATSPGRPDGAERRERAAARQVARALAVVETRAAPRPCAAPPTAPSRRRPGARRPPRRAGASRRRLGREARVPRDDRVAARVDDGARRDVLGATPADERARARSARAFLRPPHTSCGVDSDNDASAATRSSKSARERERIVRQDDRPPAPERLEAARPQPRSTSPATPSFSRRGGPEGRSRRGRTPFRPSRPSPCRRGIRSARRAASARRRARRASAAATPAEPPPTTSTSHVVARMRLTPPAPRRCRAPRRRGARSTSSAVDDAVDPHGATMLSRSPTRVKKTPSPGCGCTHGAWYAERTVRAEQRRQRRPHLARVGAVERRDLARRRAAAGDGAAGSSG